KQIRKTWDNFLDFSNNLKNKKHPENSRRTGTPYSFRHEEYAFYKIAPGKNYNTANSREYSLIREMISFTANIESVGIETYLKKQKIIWWESAIAKLNKYTNKFLNLNDKFVSGTISSSPKGYVILVNFLRENVKMVFETQCFE